MTDGLELRDGGPFTASGQDAGEMAAHVERIRVSGYSVLTTAFTAAEMTTLGTRLEGVLEQQIEEFGGSERLARADDTFTARSPLLSDELFVRVLAYPPLLALCRRLLGDYIILLQQNGIINPARQRHPQSAYHRDLPYQRFVSSRPLAISALLCVDEFRRDNGALVVVPGSHHMEQWTVPTAGEAVDTIVEASAGSFVVFDSMVVHRAGDNRSAEPRRAINHVFGVPILAQQISLPAALQGRYRDDPALARLLGYECEPARSVRDWRERRLRRRTKN